MAKKEKTERVKKEKPLRPRTIGFGMGLIMGLTFVCLIGSMVMAYMTLKNAGSSLFTTPEEVALPDFVGQSIRDVQADPNYSKFRFAIEEEFDAEVPKGTITAQTPRPPKTVKDNARITLYVSKGVEIVTIPAIIGDTYGEAVNALQDLGLIVYRELDKSDDYEANVVTRTEPDVGTSVEAGSIVTIYVNSPETYVTTSVPNVIGMSASDAISTLMGNGLNKGSITLVRGVQAGHEDVKPGCVVSQSISGGTRVAMMTSVNLVIREALAEKEWTFRFDAPFSDPSGNDVMTATLYKEGSGSASYTVGDVTLHSGINVSAKGSEDEVFLIKLNGVDYRKVKLDFQLGTSTVVADYSRTNGFVMTEPAKYRVTGKVNGDGGSVTPSADEAYVGRSVSVSISPNAGYRIVSVTDNGNDVTGSASGGSYTISNINENHTVTATFERIVYTVTVYVENGSVSGSDSVTAYYGDTVTFSVSPNENYEFSSTTAGSYSDGVLTVGGVSDNMSITVTFTEIQVAPPVDPPVDPGGEGGGEGGGGE